MTKKIDRIEIGLRFAGNLNFINLFGSWFLEFLLIIGNCIL